MAVVASAAASTSKELYLISFVMEFQLSYFKSQGRHGAEPSSPGHPAKATQDKLTLSWSSGKSRCPADMEPPTHPQSKWMLLILDQVDPQILTERYI